MECQTTQENLRYLGKLFEDYRRINLNKLRNGYPQELKNRFFLLLENGVHKSELLKVTKISPPTLSCWIDHYKKENISLAPAKELKIIEENPDLKSKIDPHENQIEKYCAKINMTNGISIELTEQGLLLSLKKIMVAV